MATPEREIHEGIAALTPAQKRRVMDYLRDRNEPPRVKPGEEWHRDLTGISDETASELRAELAADRRVIGTPGRDLLRFAGIWTDEEADEMKRLIEDAFERVEPDAGWNPPRYELHHRSAEWRRRCQASTCRRG